MTLLSVALMAAAGCGDLAARRDVKISQLMHTGETRLGKPFEVESRLPASWGEVHIVQTRGLAGPMTTVEVPGGHDVRIVLVPATAMPWTPQTQENGAGATSPFSPMAYAAYGGDVAEIRRLAAAGQNVNGGPHDYFSPLFWAANRGHEAAVRTLLGLGADPNVRTSVGQTALDQAARGGYLSIVKLLIDHHADINARDLPRVGGYTPLMYAAAHGQEATAKYLVGHGASVGTTDSKGKTAAQIAAENGHEELSTWLSEQWAELQRK